MPNRFKGITELKSNEDYEKLVSEGSITDKDGVQYEYDQLGELYITDDAVEEELRGYITDLQNKVNSLESSSSSISENKLDKNLGAENSGKLLNVDSSGNITTLDNGIAGQVLTSNGESQSPIWSNLDLPEQNVISLTGTEDNPIILLNDIEDGKSYLIGGYFKSYPSSTAIYHFPTVSEAGSIARCTGVGTDVQGRKIIEIYGWSIVSTNAVTKEVSARNANYVERIYLYPNDTSGISANSYVGLRQINYKNDINYIWAPTSGGKAGQILKSNGNNAPTWIDLPNSGIEILTGTAESPINFATDMEVNHLYSCSGVFFNTISPSAQSSISGKTVNFQDQGRSFLFYKRNDTSVVCLASSHNTNSKTTVIIFSAMYGITEITFDSTTGELTNIRSGMGFGRVNGIEGNGNAQALGIYAPTTSGTSGQILQSTGENSEPIWIDLPTSSNETNGTTITVGENEVDTLTFTSDPQTQLNSLETNKVDKEDGKGLSTNDYSTVEKSKLAGIENGAQVNVIEQINVNGTNAQITNKTVNLNITDSSLIGNKINVSLNTSTYVMTISLLNSSDGILSTADIDFPLESVIVDGSYSNGTLTLELQNGTTIPIDISSIVNGLVPTSRTINGKSLTNNITLTAEDVDALPSTTNIPSSTSDLTNDSNFVSDSSYVHTDNNYTTTEKNKLAGIEAGAQVNPTSLSELAEDSTHRLVSDTEKTTWNNKANSIDLTAKLNINQGTSNSGKILQVNSSGNIEPVNLNKKYLHRITLNLSDQPSGSPPSKTAIIHLDYYSEQSTTFTDVNFATIPYASPIGCTGYYLDTDVSITQKNIVYEISIPETSTFVINGNEVTIQIQSTGSTIQDEILGYILID